MYRLIVWNAQKEFSHIVAIDKFIIFGLKFIISLLTRHNMCAIMSTTKQNIKCLAFSYFLSNPGVSCHAYREPPFYGGFFVFCLNEIKPWFCEDTACSSRKQHMISCKNRVFEVKMQRFLTNLIHNCKNIVKISRIAQNTTLKYYIVDNEIIVFMPCKYSFTVV